MKILSKTHVAVEVTVEEGAVRIEHWAEGERTARLYFSPSDAVILAHGIERAAQEIERRERSSGE